ncbi:MAG: flavodoxin domain-containing protein [Anaerolineae bacterium]
MAAAILVAYATRHGSTEQVAETVAETLREGGFDVDCQAMRDVRTFEGYDGIVMGAPLYMYRWHVDARRFLSRHREALVGRPVAVFALGPVHEPYDEEEWRDSRAQLHKELAAFPWLEPVAVELFGGRFDPESLRFPINLFARAEPASDIRDWTAIRTWAEGLGTSLGV